MSSYGKNFTAEQSVSTEYVRDLANYKVYTSTATTPTTAIDVGTEMKFAVIASDLATPGPSQRVVITAQDMNDKVLKITGFEGDSSGSQPHVNIMVERVTSGPNTTSFEIKRTNTDFTLSEGTPNTRTFENLAGTMTFWCEFQRLLQTAA